MRVERCELIANIEVKDKFIQAERKTKSKVYKNVPFYPTLPFHSSTGHILQMHTRCE